MDDVVKVLEAPAIELGLDGPAVAHFQCWCNILAPHAICGEGLIGVSAPDDAPRCGVCSEMLDGEPFPMCEWAGS